MSNLPVRRNESKTTTEWDPFRAMRALLRWDPFQEMTPMIPTGEDLAFMPAFDVKETKTSFVLHADLPGMKEGDIEVSITGNRMTVQGKRDQEKKEESETYYLYERNFGSFTRSFTLPDGTDGSNVKADLKDGVLTIEIAKLPEVQAKKIPVQAAAPTPPTTTSTKAKA